MVKLGFDEKKFTVEKTVEVTGFGKVRFDLFVDVNNGNDIVFECGQVKKTKLDVLHKAGYDICHLPYRKKIPIFVRGAR